MCDQTPHKLQERVKELTALHRTARILQDESRPGAEVIRDIVRLLPGAWQYPEITEVRIRFQDVDEATQNFAITPWMQTARFVTRTRIEGTIEVAYREERPTEDEGLFLAEERDLIDSLADMLRSYFQHKMSDLEVQRAYDNLEQIVSQRTEELRRTNSKLSKK